MPTQCTAEQLEFAGVGRRRVVAAFDGGQVTSDAGALLLKRTDAAIGLVDRVASCFEDRRSPHLVEHSMRTLLGQRLFGLALGYEDLNDHDELRRDPLFGVLMGKLEAKRADCEALAGKSTLNRLELYPKAGSSAYHKIVPDTEALERLFVELFLDSYVKAPKKIVLDLDATDVALHGEQEGRFFHGYYDHYCYLPLYIYCGQQLLCAKLRRSNIDGAAGSVEELTRIVGQIRERWPKTRIILRADSGFARDALMSWCEAQVPCIDYVFGLAKNARLKRKIADELQQAEALATASGHSRRLFKELVYRTHDSWSRQRRVVAKAEATPQGQNPRFVVTSLSIREIPGRKLYEKFYCARGEAENRIKECQLDLFGDRLSANPMRVNQLRLWFASFAYVLMESLRRLALPSTRLARASAGSIRLKLLKIGATVTISVRRVKLAMSSAHPHQAEFRAAFDALTAAAR